MIRSLRFGAFALMVSVGLVDSTHAEEFRIADNGTAFLKLLFATDKLDAMVGQAPHGNTIAFHPGLNLAAVNHHGQEVELMNAKSLVSKMKFELPGGGGDSKVHLLAFGGKGTNLIVWNGDNPQGPTEGLHILPLPLSSEKRGILTKAYGTLPPAPKATAAASKATPTPSDAKASPATWLAKSASNSRPS
jgi:hypothetical protein